MKRKSLKNYSILTSFATHLSKICTRVLSAFQTRHKFLVHGSYCKRVDLLIWKIVITQFVVKSKSLTHVKFHSLDKMNHKTELNELKKTITTNQMLKEHEHVTSFATTYWFLCFISK